MIALVATFAVAAAALIGGLVIRDRRSDAESSSPATPTPTFAMAGKFSWTGPAGESASSDEKRLAWATDDLLVFATLETGAITALRKSTGEQAWQFQIPEPDGNPADQLICTASQDIGNDAVAIVFARSGVPDNRQCTGLMLFDLRTGKPRWTVTDHVPAYTPNGTRVELAAGMVMLSAPTQLIAYDVISSAQRWAVDLSKQPGDCGAAQVGRDPRELVAAVSCANRDEIWTLDPASGKVLSRTALQGRRTTILSVSPTVTYSVEGYLAEVLSPDRRRVAHTVGVTIDILDWPEAPRTIRVWKSYLIAVPLSPASPISVWNLATGQRIWSRVVPTGEGRPETDWGQPAIAGIDERGIVCLVRPVGVDKDAQHRVVRLDLTTGEPTYLSAFFEAPPHDPRRSWLFVDPEGIYGVEYEKTLYSREAAVAFALE